MAADVDGDRSFSLTVVGVDRPGIIAGVTRVLFDQGCNLEDATSTILRGHFSMMLIVRVPEDSVEGLDGALRSVADELGVDVVLRALGDARVDLPPPTHIVSVYGADKPGILHGVSRSLAAAGVNVTDMTSRVIGEEGDPVYAVMLEVAVADGDDVEALLDEVAADLDVDASIHPIEIDVL